jgi:hypothetical protein
VDNSGGLIEPLPAHRFPIGRIADRAETLHEFCLSIEATVIMSA